MAPSDEIAFFNQLTCRYVGETMVSTKLKFQALKECDLTCPRMAVLMYLCCVCIIRVSSYGLVILAEMFNLGSLSADTDELQILSYISIPYASFILLVTQVGCSIFSMF